MKRAQEGGYTFEDTSVLRTKDGYGFKLERDQNADQGLLGVSLNVENLERARDYYVHVLGMDIKQSGEKWVRVGYAEKNLVVELVESGEVIDHAVAIGRLAIAVPAAQMDIIEKRVAENKERVHTKRIKLDTPGKATVEVVILLDRDGYEICIVGSEAFYELCQPVPGGEFIDWQQRIESGSKELQ